MISIVIPIYNEAQTLPLLYSRLVSAMPSYNDQCEVIFVDDGSTDASFAIMKQYSKECKIFRAIKLSRNFGHQAAISAGLKFASGDVVAIMDGDLQDPPEELPRFLDKWRQGYDVVYAVREKRKEGVLKRFAYKYFYKFLNMVSDIDIPLDSGDFCLLDRKVVDILNDQLPENIRFLRGMRSYIGLRQAGLQYERHKRAAGEAKYTFKKLVSLALDGIFGFTLLPLRMATYTGMFISLVCFLLTVFYLSARIFSISLKNVPGFATLAVGVFFLGGIMLIYMGVLGEYIGRIYIEVKKRPVYVVEEIIQMNEDEK